MSTKAIREVLALFKHEASFPESPRARMADKALAEVEAIERVAEEMRLAAGVYDGGPNEEILGTTVREWADTISSKEQG